MIFGDQYHIQISSFEGIGTIVKYRLPVIRPEEETEQEDGHV